jgi:hypothetical protein
MWAAAGLARIISPDSVRSSSVEHSAAYASAGSGDSTAGIVIRVDHRPELDDDPLTAINGWREDVPVPAIGRPVHGMLEFDTYGPTPVGTTVVGETFTLRPRSVVVLRAPR